MILQLHTDITVNLNWKVRVKLTDLGLQALNSHWGPYLKPGRSIPGLRGMEFTTQLWDLMNIFGPDLRMGFNHVPFETDIIIEVER